MIPFYMQTNMGKHNSHNGSGTIGLLISKTIKKCVTETHNIQNGLGVRGLLIQKKISFPKTKTHSWDGPGVRIL